MHFLFFHKNFVFKSVYPQKSKIYSKNARNLQLGWVD